VNSHPIPIVTPARRTLLDRIGASKKKASLHLARTEYCSPFTVWITSFGFELGDPLFFESTRVSILINEAVKEVSQQAVVFYREAV
jgi:hypothetical protein